MQRRVFFMKIKSGMKNEYVKRRDNLWPEMRTMFKESGVCNNLIWWVNDTLIGYYESEDIDKTQKYHKRSLVFLRCREYMDYVMDRGRTIDRSRTSLLPKIKL